MNDQEFEKLHRSDAKVTFLTSAVQGDRARFISNLENLDWPEAWPDTFRALVRFASNGTHLVHPDIKRAFAEMWDAKLGEFQLYKPCGRRLHKIFREEISLLCDALRILLPPMRDDPPVILYRGQSEEAYSRGITGLSWTPEPTMAELYARIDAMNSMPCVVIGTFIPTDAIIGQISPVELVLDPNKINNTHIVYKPKSKFVGMTWRAPQAAMDLDCLSGLNQRIRR